MSLLRLVPVAATLTVIGCTSADVLRLDRTPRPQTRPESIQLIAQEPQQPYTVIAIVSARAEQLGKFGNARERLLKEAAKLGGEAIILDSSSLTRVGGDDSERTQITGKVIVFDRTSRSN